MDTIEIDFNVKQLVRRLELQKGRDYKIQDIAKLSGVNRFTLGSLMSENQQEGITRKTMARLLSFFRSQGMVITISDLFAERSTPPAS